MNRVTRIIAVMSIWNSLHGHNANKLPCYVYTQPDVATTLSNTVLGHILAGLLASTRHAL